MKEKELQSSMARRSFLARLGMGIGVVGASVATPAVAALHSPVDLPWRPASHAQDEWFDRITGQHRFVFDTTNPDGMASALQYANNYFLANRDAYGLKDSDLAVVIIARHRSTPFGFNSAMWARYGKQFTEQTSFTDPKPNEPFSNAVSRLRDRMFTRVNMRNVYADSKDDSGHAGLMSQLIDRGVHFAVCQTATRKLCGTIAHATGSQADTIFKEIEANLIPNAHLVSAGIVALNRAQERGYSCVCVA